MWSCVGSFSPSLIQTCASAVHSDSQGPSHDTQSPSLASEAGSLGGGGGVGLGGGGGHFPAPLYLVVFRVNKIPFPMERILLARHGRGAVLAVPSPLVDEVHGVEGPPQLKLWGGGVRSEKRGVRSQFQTHPGVQTHLVRRRAQVHHLERSSAVPVEVKPTGVGTTRPTLSTATLRFIPVDRVLVWQIGGRSGGGGRAGHKDGRKNGRKERHGRGRGRHAGRQVTL